MNRFLFGALLLSLLCISGLLASSADRDKPKQPSRVAELLRNNADEIIKRFDKNKDGVLTRDEVPGIEKETCDKLDSNRDGKLDAKEVERARQALRAMETKEVEKLFEAIRERNVVVKESKPDGADAEVARWLQTMDRNKDGKISRQEAQGRLREFFAAIDVNRDGFLDKRELQLAAVRMLAVSASKPAQPSVSAPTPGGPPPDFDTVDQNADGRITREELEGTPYLQAFDAIDANKDGKISPKEWDAYVKKQAAAKDKVTGKN